MNAIQVKALQKWDVSSSLLMMIITLPYILVHKERLSLGLFPIFFVLIVSAVGCYWTFSKKQHFPFFTTPMVCAALMFAQLLLAK